jgi:hypothetical protein
VSPKKDSEKQNDPAENDPSVEEVLAAQKQAKTEDYQGDGAPADVDAVAQETREQGYGASATSPEGQERRAEAAAVAGGKNDNTGGPQATQTIGGEEFPTSTQEQAAARGDAWQTFESAGHIEVRETGDDEFEVRLVVDGPDDGKNKGLTLNGGQIRALFAPVRGTSAR